uniref:Putative licpodalin-4 1 n=1 Tax=Amblyomma triste TaxID=251400 RepID=A0A023GDC8_AMBTT
MAALYAIYTLAVAGTVSCVLYEDDPRYAGSQHVSDFTAVPDLMFVMRQSRVNAFLPSPICQAMMKLGPVSDGEFRYIVYYSTETARRNMKAFVTKLSLAITPTANGHRQHPNAMTFRTSQRGPFISFKLMYADTLNGCFVIVSYLGDLGRRACRLLLSSRSVSRVIPVECLQVYTENCPQESRIMYFPGCARRIPHIVEWGR